MYLILTSLNYLKLNEHVIAYINIYTAITIS